MGEHIKWIIYKLIRDRKKAQKNVGMFYGNAVVSLSILSVNRMLEDWFLYFLYTNNFFQWQVA